MGNFPLESAKAGMAEVLLVSFRCKATGDVNGDLYPDIYISKRMF
jgi:hypothetical protein